VTLSCHSAVPLPQLSGSITLSGTSPISISTYSKRNSRQHSKTVIRVVPHRSPLLSDIHCLHSPKVISPILSSQTQPSITSRWALSDKPNMLKSLTPRAVLLSSYGGNVSQAGSPLARLTSDVHACALSARISCHALAHSQNHAIPYASHQRQHVPNIKKAKQMHVRSLTSGANIHESEDGQLKIHDETQTGKESLNAPVQCSIRVKSLMHRGEWHTVPALKTVHTDRFRKRRAVYVGLERSEPDAEEMAAEWPEVCVTQRQTEIEEESAQPGGEQKEVTRRGV